MTPQRKASSTHLTVYAVVVLCMPVDLMQPCFSKTLSRSFSVPNFTRSLHTNPEGNYKAALSTSLSGQVGAAAGTVASSEVAVKGIYSNYDYAFLTRIPRGFVGYRAGAPSPNHGFVIRLTSGQGELSVDANYNAAGWSSLDNALTARLEELQEETGRHTTLVKRAVTFLGGLKAIRFLIRAEPSNNSEAIMSDAVIALRSAPGEVGIVYDISLTTPESAYATNAKLLESLRQSFRLRSLPR